MNKNSPGIEPFNQSGNRKIHPNTRKNAWKEIRAARVARAPLKNSRSSVKSFSFLFLRELEIRKAKFDHIWSTFYLVVQDLQKR